VAAPTRSRPRRAPRSTRSSLSPKTRASLDTELAAARTFANEIGASEIAAARPLAADAELARVSPLLSAPELAPVRHDAEARVRAAGQQTCAHLRAAPQTPNWTIIVARYCAHFGEPAASAAPPAPLAVSGVIKGLSPAQANVVRSRVADWFRASMWSKAGDATAGRAGLAGTFEATIQHASVTLHAPYEASVTTHKTKDRTEGGEVLANAFRSIGARSGRPRRLRSASSRDREDLRPRRHVRAGRDRSAARHAAFGRYLARARARPRGACSAQDAEPTVSSAFCAHPTFELEDAARCLVVRPQKAALAVVAGTIGESAERLATVLGPPPPPRPATPAGAAPPRARRAASPPASSGATDDEDPGSE
jgi:hypothetical protein